MIARVKEGSVGRLVFAHQNARDFARQTPDGQSVGVNDMPLPMLLQTFATWKVGCHRRDLHIKA
jgi:hypothetical protein